MSPSRNTPLPARSVLASVLLGTDPPWLPTALLVRTASLFGITDGAVRTALSRMAGTGEVVAERGGYRLAGHLVDRQQRQSESRRAQVREWDGTWELATIVGDEARAASDRSRLRHALRTLRLSELREGVWGRPDNLDAHRSPEASTVLDAWCVRWRGARPSTVPDLTRLWALDTWASEAHQRRHEISALVAPLESDDATALADGFVTSAGVLRLFQHDPLLPAELAPPAWPGADLRDEYDRFDRSYREALRRWFRQAG